MVLAYQKCWIRPKPAQGRVMDLEVTSTEPGQSVVDNVETVEVVTGEDNDIDANSSSSGLMEQHIIVTNPQELMSNAEVRFKLIF